MRIVDLVYPKHCVGCRAGGQYICNHCINTIRRKGKGLAYEGVIRKMIKEIKYRGTWDMVSELVEIWHPPKPEGEVIITSVPMWRQKQKMRGYNQAELIARQVAIRWEVKYFELLTRTKETRPMYGLSKVDRVENVRGAFGINSQIDNLPIPKLSRVVLIDDVWTSGATLNECSRVLRTDVYKNVECLALAG